MLVQIQIYASAATPHTCKHAHIYKVEQVFDVGVCTHMLFRTHTWPIVSFIRHIHQIPTACDTITVNTELLINMFKS